MDPKLAITVYHRPGNTSWAQLAGGIAARNSRLAASLAARRDRASGGVSAAIKLERQRIAQELHAGAGQPLSGIHINLEILEEFVRTPAEPNKRAAEEAIRRLRHLAAEASGQVRAVSHHLQPPDWQRLPFPAALHQLIDSSGVKQRFLTEVRIGELPGELTHEIKVALYRCAQECIANVIRHSEATRVVFDLGVHEAAIYLCVIDNGKGFHPALSGDGLGLRAMLRHAESLGGVRNIQSGPEGSRIEIRIPLGPDSIMEEL